jgi:hypothetical protein
MAPMIRRYSGVPRHQPITPVPGEVSMARSLAARGAMSSGLVAGAALAVRAGRTHAG